ncbi:MAG: ribonuclease Z [Desulfobacteraceae bacterium]|nr:ribonuclease Z [Desulfobacteraceae bacterium]
MKITIVGSGTCVPRLERSSSSVLIESDSVKILLDLGLGTIRRLLEYGVTIDGLTHIFLSHFHPDHTCELAPLLFATKYPGNLSRITPLILAGGPGINDFYHALQAAYGDWIVLPDEQFAICQLDPMRSEKTKWGDLTVHVRPVSHRPESLAIRIENRAGKSVVYSGDTDKCDALADLAHETDLFICESAMPDEKRVPGHLTPGLAAEIASKARVKQLVLTHLYPACDQVDIAKQAANVYKGLIIVAQDLMSFRLA